MSNFASLSCQSQPTTTKLKRATEQNLNTCGKLVPFKDAALDGCDISMSIHMMELPMGSKFQVPQAYTGNICDGQAQSQLLLRSQNSTSIVL